MISSNGYGYLTLERVNGVYGETGSVCWGMACIMGLFFLVLCFLAWAGRMGPNRLKQEN